MAKFKTQGSTLLVQHFGALNASALEPLLLAVLTSQLEMPRRKFLDALRQYCRLTLKEASARPCGLTALNICQRRHSKASIVTNVRLSVWGNMFVSINIAHGSF